MAPKKHVPTLYSCSYKSFSLLADSATTHFMEDEDAFSFMKYTDFLETVKRRLCNIPAEKQAEIAQAWIGIAKKLDKLYGYSADEVPDVPPNTAAKTNFAIKSLIIISADFLDLVEVHYDSDLFTTNLMHHLWRMKELKILWLSSELDQTNQKVLEESIPFLRNLREFRGDEGCTNETVKVLCENCFLLETLELESYLITDESIEFLASLKKLKNLQLGFTKISEGGFAKLLIASQSTYLVDILGHYHGSRYCSADFFQHLVAHVVPFRTFNLRSFNCRKISSDILSLIAKFFPNMESINLSPDENDILDISLLNSLENLVDVTLRLYSNLESIGRLWSMASPVLTELSLSGSNDLPVDINCLLQFALQCPNMKSISLNECTFSNDANFVRPFLPQRPFEKLREFHFSRCYRSDCDNDYDQIPFRFAYYIDVILRHAVNIERISLSNVKGLTDEFIHIILKFNDLSNLESLSIFPVRGISAKMFKFLINTCPNLCKIGNFGLGNSDTQKKKLEELQKYVTQSNFNVELE